jgi:hypothetical protein
MTQAIGCGEWLNGIPKSLPFSSGDLAWVYPMHLSHDIEDAEKPKVEVLVIGINKVFADSYGYLYYLVECEDGTRCNIAAFNMYKHWLSRRDS